MEYQYGQNDNEHSYQNNNDYIYYHSNYSNSYGAAPKEPSKKKREKKGGTVALTLVLSLVMGTAGGMLGSGLMLRQYNIEGTKEAGNQKTQGNTALEQGKGETAVQETAQSSTGQMPQAGDIGLSVEQISKMCLPSVVAITNKGEAEIRSFWGTFIQETEGSGSGVIIGETDSELLIVTNYHVVSGSKELSVLFSYQEQMENSSGAEIVEGEIKDYSTAKDLAVIAVDLSKLSQETMDNIKIATLGDSNELSLGEQVVAIGNALGYGQSVTTGVVSALERSVTEEDSQNGTGIANKYIQTDAAINPGNSGGALFNMNGELVGINSAKMAATNVEGIGYAIPISDIRGDMEGMMERETKAALGEAERGYLGVSVSNVTSEINRAYDIPIGVYISSVTENSPAEKAGLQRGMVITEVDRRAIRTREELVDYLGYYKSGETVTLTVEVRGGDGYETRQISVTLYSAEEAGIETQSESGTTPQEVPESNKKLTPNEGYSFGNLFPFFGE